MSPNSVLSVPESINMCRGKTKDTLTKHISTTLFLVKSPSEYLQEGCILDLLFPFVIITQKDSLLIMSKKGGASAAASLVQLLVPAGKASAQPPVGPALGAKGVKAMDFAKVSRQTRTRNLLSLSYDRKTDLFNCPYR